MLLPKAPKAPAFKTERINAFYGVDVRGGAPAGSLVSSSGVSLRERPYLCAGRPLISASLDTGVTDFFEARGRLVTVRDGGVYIDGEYVCPAEGTRLSRAVIGDRLFITPGNVFYDLESKRVFKADEKYASGSAYFTVENNKAVLRASLVPERDVKIAYQKAGNDNLKKLDVYCYNGLSEAELRALFDPETGEWDKSALREVRIRCELNTYDTLHELAGSLIIPKDDGDIDAISRVNPKEPQLNTDGDIAVVLEKKDANGVFYVTYRTVSGELTESPDYSAGDRICVTGSEGGFFDGEYVAESVSYDTQTCGLTVTFSGAPYAQPSFYAVTEAPLPAGKRSVTIKNDDFARRVFEVDTTLPAESILFVTVEKDAVYVRSPGSDKTERYAFVSADNLRAGDVRAATAYPSQHTGVFVQRAFPALDFVCEKDGRLCGVSNADKKIYLSAPGAPEKFYDYAGGSYSLECPSDGDFTALTSYGGALCCFKEREIIKLFGASPLDFYAAFYPAAGVKKGSSRSLVACGGALYYKGESGFMSYGGAYPKRISDALGYLPDNVTAAGADGGCYFASTDGALYTLDLKSGLWVKDEGGFSAIERAKGELCFCRGGEILRFDGRAAPGEWSAVFTPFYGKTCGKKAASAISVRIELSKGAYADVFLSEDGAPYRRVLTLPGGAERTVSAQVKTRPCDRFGLMLSGRGEFRLKAIERKYREI
ncbi:MAG: hypothetical protein IJS65_04355 [Clostridia bacterium]|nr:hypothetical protein [Clostridia bacterium]